LFVLLLTGIHQITGKDGEKPTWRRNYKKVTGNPAASVLDSGVLSTLDTQLSTQLSLANQSSALRGGGPHG